MSTPLGTLTQAREFWQGQPAARRRLFLLVGGLTLGGLLVLGTLASRPPQYAPLFTNLVPSDAEAIVQQLTAQKVPYRLSPDGSVISVPGADVARMRLALAAQGLPNAGTVGLGIVDKLGISATNFQQQVDYLRGLQGELARTIMQIDGVASARVHIVLPTQQVFSQTAPQATAAVLVRLKPGVQLSAEQVGAVTHLVASSVQGLKPQDVTVVDQTGQLLSSQGTNPAGATAGGDLQMQQQFQQRLQASLDRLLGQVFGVGNVVTHVQAQLNFDRQTVTQKLFTPSATGQGLVQSLQQLSQRFQGQGAVPAGIPGTASNSVPNYAAATVSGGGPSQYTQNQKKESFALDQTQTQTVVAPGAVKRLSVAVVVNRQLTPSDQQAVVSLVSAAIGADPARNDQLSVVGMPFSNSLAKQLGTGAPAPRRTQTPVALYAALAAAVAVVVALALLLRGGARRKREDDGERQLATELLAKARGEDGMPDGQPAYGDPNFLKLNERVQRRPEDLAAILRAWMNED